MSYAEFIRDFFLTFFSENVNFHDNFLRLFFSFLSNFPNGRPVILFVK